MFHKLFHRLRSLLRRSKIEREMDAEMRFHLEMEIAENIRRGMCEEDARLAARRSFGGIEQTKETYRDVIRFRWIEDLWQDLRYGLRMLLKRPGFTAVVIFTLTLGIGVNTAIFTMFNAQLRPLPIADPDSVAKLKYRSNQGFSYPDYVHFRDHQQVFSGLIAYQYEKFLLGTDVSRTEFEEVGGEFVDEDHFSVLGASTILGRTFTREENSVPGKNPVVVISQRLWQGNFAGDPTIIGRTVFLNRKPFTVIGVMERGFVSLTMPNNTDIPGIWLPLMMRSELLSVNETLPENPEWFGKRDFPWLQLAGRLKPGRTIEEARAEMAVLLSQLAQSSPEIDPKDSIRLTPATALGDRGNRGEFWQLMVIVLTATGMVLLIACSNIANLLLARAAGRQREIGVRLCLGASRGRVIRQLLTESFLLAGTGGAAALLLAWWSVPFLARALHSDLDTLAINYTPDLRILSYTFVLSLVSGIVFGLAPALRATSTDLLATIKDMGAAVGQTKNRSWFRSGLIVTQVALCLMLLIPAGLLLRALVRAISIDPGYPAEKLLSLSYSLELSGYTEARAKLFQRELIEKVKSLPGVLQVSQGDMPLGGMSRAKITLPEENGTPAKRFERGTSFSIDSNSLETIGIPIVQGRGFTQQEVRSDAAVVIVNQATARNLWPGKDPIGKLLRVEIGGATPRFVQVIGVARDAQMARFGEIPTPFLFKPLVQNYWFECGLLVRTSGAARDLKPIARATVRSLEPVIRLWLDTIDEEIANSKWGITSTRVAAKLATCLGLLALLLAAIGIYGVMAFSVSQRTHEIGIRMALGAQTSDVLKLVLRQGIALVVIGVLIGGFASLALTRLLTSLLYGLSATDPLTFVVIAFLLTIVALLACYLPARRAMKVDPMVALRYE